MSAMLIAASAASIIGAFFGMCIGVAPERVNTAWLMAIAFAVLLIAVGDRK